MPFKGHFKDWSGEFDFVEFVSAFKTNPRFLRKAIESRALGSSLWEVSLATCIPVRERLVEVHIYIV